MAVIGHEPGAIRVSAEDCENASLPAAAQTLRDLADEVEASRPQLRGVVEDAAKWEALARRLYALMGEDAERLVPGDVESVELLRQEG